MQVKFECDDDGACLSTVSVHFLFEKTSPLTISHTIRPNDWHRVSLSFSFSLSVSLSSRDSIFEEKHHHVLYPGRLGGPEIELQVTVCRARRASELSRGMRGRFRNSHIRTGTHVRVRNVTYVLIPRISLVSLHRACVSRFLSSPV